MLRQKITGSLQEVVLPDFPDDDDNTVTTTVTKSRRVSFGPNFVKEFIVDSAISAQCMAEYEQPFPSSDSSSPFVLQDNPKPHKPDPDTSENRHKPPKFASTICFSADSPTADMEFTEGCITLAKSILDKKNKEMTVFIQAKPKGAKGGDPEEKAGEDDGTHLEGAQLEMSMTQCLSSREKTKIFARYEDEMSMTRCERLLRHQDAREDDHEDDSKENRMPLDAIMRFLDRDDSDSDLFNPEKSFAQLLAANNSLDLSDESEKLDLNESMEISGERPDVDVPGEMPPGGVSEKLPSAEPTGRLGPLRPLRPSDDEAEAPEQECSGGGGVVEAPKGGWRKDAAQTPVPFAEDVSCEEMAVEEMTDEETVPEEGRKKVGSEGIETEKMVVEEMMCEKVTVEDMIVEKMVSEKVISGDMADEKMEAQETLTEEKIGEKMVTPEKVPEKMPTEKLVPEETAAKKTRTEEMLAEEMSPEKMGTEEAETEKVINEEISPGKTQTEKITAEKMATQEKISEKMPSQKSTSEEIVAEKMPSESIITEKMEAEEKIITQDIAIEKMPSEKMTPEERAAKKSRTEETLAEETLTEDLMDLEPPWNPPPFAPRPTASASGGLISLHEDDSPREPSLGDLKLIQTLKEQANEKGCVWSLGHVHHPRTRSQGSLSFTCTLLDSTATLRFSLKLCPEDTLHSCSLVTDSSLLLDADHQSRLPEYALALGFGFEQLTRHLGALQGVATLRHVPYYMDRVNSFLSKMNAYLRQMLAVLTSYPGSRLEGCRLSFRLFSFPIFLSCVVSVDLSNVFRLSRGSLRFAHDFGCLDEKKVGEIFEESLKGEDSLCEFVVRSTRYLVELERQSGYLSKRKHIRLLPDELKS